MTTAKDAPATSTREGEQGALSELIARLEQASGPDRELDALIGVNVIGFDPDKLPTHLPDIGEIPSPWPKYTASIDAALTLVPVGYYWSVSGGMDDLGAPRGMEGMFSACCPEQPVSFSRRDWAYHPALALCIAALKARNPHPHPQPERE